MGKLTEPITESDTHYNPDYKMTGTEHEIHIAKKKKNTKNDKSRTLNHNENRVNKLDTPSKNFQHIIKKNPEFQKK